MSDFKSAFFSDSDPGLFSLSQIMHLMRVEFGRSQRYGYPLACILIAVDRLGHLRDVYGYESKEAILEEVVKLLQRETRTCDFLGRLMDDRLLAIVPHTPPGGTEVLAERLLRGVRELRFEADGKEVRVTVSIGASSNAGGRTLFFDSVLAAAEGALAEAADGGGDRLVQRDPDPVAG